MFILDSLMIAGIRWTLETVVSAAEAEMNDDTALREQLLEALQQCEQGEISEERYAEIEAGLLARIREIKERREGGSGPVAFASSRGVGEAADQRIQVDASVQGDFHEHEPSRDRRPVVVTSPERARVQPSKPPATARATRQPSSRPARARRPPAAAPARKRAHRRRP